MDGGYEEAWERYIAAERRDLEARRGGRLGRAIGTPLPGESLEELERLAREDQQRAEEGLVELRSGYRVWYKHIDDLTREDRPARLAAETEQAKWLKERAERFL